MNVQNFLYSPGVGSGDDRILGPTGGWAGGASVMGLGKVVASGCVFEVIKTGTQES